uniref:chitobiase/beta-hexosaminidase C-terminal domain-containing protein n=1 Tax=Candidatus Limisoma sp. TaxID=3076476 RepID=UPI003FEF2E7F
MKKFYFLFLFALIASIGNLYAAEKTVTFDATVDKSPSMTLSKDGITLLLTDGKLNNGTDYRTYKGNILTISSECNITKIVFTCTANGTAKGGPGGFKTSSGYSYKDKTGTWEGTSKSIAFNAEANQVRAKTIEVTYDAPVETKCAKPTFNLTADATYTDAQTLEITSTTTDATIHYTVNGGEEKIGRLAEFTENGKYTVDAWAKKDGLTDSEHAPITFTISKKMNKPTFNLTEGAVYGEAKVLEITSDKVGAQIEYTVVGGGNISITKTEASPVNVTLDQNGEYTVEASVLEMDDYAKSDAAGLNFKIELAAGVPTFSVEEGTYPEAQTITLTPGEGGAQVFYTINGGTEQPFIEPIKLEEDGTYKIAAYTAGTETLAKSATVTKTYIISLPLEEPYILCEDAAWLTEGANIIFASSVAAGEQKAMSKLQKTNNRGAASVTIGSAFNAGKETVGIVSKDADVAVFTVGISNGHITFYTGDSRDAKNNSVAGYLYAANSKDNQLKTQNNVDDNAEWTVAVATNGEATIKAQGNNTRNWMRYNPNNGAMFSCYTGGQDPIYIYLLGKTSSVSSMSAEGIKVFAAEGGVEVVAAEAAEVAVYTVAGQLVRQARVAEGSTLVNVAPGFYVVRANGTATKVIVR